MSIRLIHHCILLEADRETLLKQRHSTYFAPRLARADEILASDIIPQGAKNIYDKAAVYWTNPPKNSCKKFFEPYQS